jgi:DNA-binding transcriptional LysR family regulator
MDLRHLKYFVVVAEECHFGRAAQRLHMAQPPLSRTIRQLEAELGFQLFERTTRSVNLTPAGAAFLDEARDVLKTMAAIGTRAHRVAEGLEGQLSVGCVGSATYSLLPQFARVLRTRLPHVEVSFRGEMLAPDQVAALRDGTLDLALMRPAIGLAGELRTTVLREDRLLVAVPADHPFAQLPHVEVKNLENENLVSHEGRSGSAMRQMVTRMCDDAGFQARVVQEVAETSTLLTFVAAGLGIAVVPEPTALLGVPGVAHVPLSNTNPVLLVAATRDEPDPVIERAVTILQEIAKSSGPAPPVAAAALHH